MKMVIEITMDNDAFHDEGLTPSLARGQEVHRILKKLADRSADYGVANRGNGFLQDANGATVGSWSVTP